MAAPQDRATLNATYNQSGSGQFPDNTSRSIAPSNLRSGMGSVFDSFRNIVDDSYIQYTVTASGTDTYTASLSPVITAYASSHIYWVLFTNANTGAATLNLNSLGAKSIKKNGSTALSAGDISAGQIYALAYDGTNLQIVGAISSASSATYGTYTPTLTNTTNITASTAAQCQYMKVGNVVTVSGSVSIQATAAGATELGMSLPVASNFTIVSNLGGVASSAVYTVLIQADATNDRAKFSYTASGSSNTVHSFTFTYLVI